MASEAVEVSDGTCLVGDTSSSLKSKACDSLLHTISETKNLLSVNSSYDSLSENAENESPLRLTRDDLKGAEKLPNKFCDSKVVVGHENNISRVSRANDTNIVVSNHNGTVERRKNSCSLASVGSVGAEDPGKLHDSVLSEMHSLKDSGAGSGTSKDKLQECSEPMEISTKFEPETSEDGQDPKHKAMDCSGHSEQDVKSNVQAAGAQSLQSSSGDESDESDIVEQDVNVCDICGDAGREDQLATCSRCIDGAEHIYCMRKMLRRVPKGDWLCEECKLAEETENQKQGTNVDGNRMKKAILSKELSNKRHAEHMEVAPLKRRALETQAGSPKLSSPKRAIALSRESSFRSTDKDKLKLANQTSQCHNDISETARSPTTGAWLQTANGAFLKSNSFNTFSSKPKGKPVDNIVPPKQKGSKEHTSHDMKEKAVRMMGKSQSFKSANSGHSNVSEPKVKMLPSKLPLHDLKGLRQVKERSTIERKSLSKLERPLVGTTTSSAFISSPKADQVSRGDTSALLSLKSTGSLNRKGVETQCSPGGPSPVSGLCDSASEQKSNHFTTSNEAVEKSPSDVERKLEDMPQSWEKTNQVDNKESSVRFRSTVAASTKGLLCPTCKEMGHTAECCTNGISQASVSDVSLLKSYKDEVPKGSRLRDAIQAALLRKPEIYRKKTALDQSDEVSVPNMELSSELASPDQLFASNMSNNNMFMEGSHDGQAISGTSNLYKTTNDRKPPNVQPANSVIPSRVADSGSVVPEKSTMKDLHSHPSLGMSVIVKTTAIPEYDYIWLGSFELQRAENILELCGGIQAHLSTCASPKVPEVVNKFQHKVSLKEVPRLSVWPTQFSQTGVKEDNIALYFFAKDLDIYERNYKIIVDTMMKNDSALIGKFGGVELLVLPSNQLPEKSQRWNMLYFLWGVFRETKVHYLDSTRKMDISCLRNVSLDCDDPAVMTLSKNLHIPDHIGSIDSSSGVASAKSPELAVPTVGQDLEGKDTYPQEMCGGSKHKLVEQDSMVDSKYTKNNAGLSGGVKCAAPTLREICLGESKADIAGTVGMETIADRGNMVGVTGGHDEEVILKKLDRIQLKQEREVKRGDESKETEAAFVTDLTTRINSSQSNDITHPRKDLLETANQQVPWNVVNSSMQRDGESDSKKPKLGSSGFHGFSTSQPVACCSKEKKTCEEKVIQEDLGTTERHFFPVESSNNSQESLSWKSLPSSAGNENAYKSDGFPSLELALRAEAKPKAAPSMPFFVGLGDERDEQMDDRASEKEKEDDVSASLSLSLSFPFSADKEHSVRPPPATMPERNHVNTSLLLFRRFLDK